MNRISGTVMVETWFYSTLRLLHLHVEKDGLDLTVIHAQGGLDLQDNATPATLDGLETTVMSVRGSDSPQRVDAQNVSRMGNGKECCMREMVYTSKCT